VFTYKIQPKYEADQLNLFCSHTHS